MIEITHRLTLPPEPSSAAAARRFVADALQGCAIDIDIVVLLVSELVSNVVLHAGTPLEVEVASRGAHMRISVTDGSSAVPTLKHDPPDSVTGRGLTMIATAAASWGIDLHAGGKSVWFEVPISSGPLVP